MYKTKLEELLRQCFKQLEPNLDDDVNFKDTPNRYAKFLKEFWWNDEKINKEINKIFEVVYPSKLDELIISKGIDVWMICPHHLLPVHMKVNIGYLPNGLVLGLSKLPRIANILAKKPRLQEDYTSILADTILSKLNPRGVMIVIKGEHLCVKMRGVKDNSTMITSAIRGDFHKNNSLKYEFLQLVNKL